MTEKENTALLELYSRVLRLKKHKLFDDVLDDILSMIEDECDLLRADPGHDVRYPVALAVSVAFIVSATRGKHDPRYSIVHEVLSEWAVAHRSSLQPGRSRV